MRALFLLGWILMVCAFAAAAAEVAAGAVAGHGSAPGFGDLWRALAPDSYVAIRGVIAEPAPWLWAALLAGPLALPGWLLFGLPGVLLAWFCRPGRAMTADEREDLAQREDSLFLYDELAREARRQAYADGYDPREDDSVPDHFSHDLLEAAEREEVEVDRHVLEEIRRLDGDTRPPGKGGD